MLGTLVAVGVGYLAFKVGTMANEKKHEGKDGAQITGEILSEACESTKNAFSSCKDRICGQNCQNCQSSEKDKDGNSGSEDGVGNGPTLTGCFC